MSRSSTFLAALTEALAVTVPAAAAEGPPTVTNSAQPQQASGPAPDWAEQHANGRDPSGVLTASTAAPDSFERIAAVYGARTMSARRTRFARIAVVVAVVALGAGVVSWHTEPGAASPALRVRADPTGWYTAIRFRSEALSLTYGLGNPTRAVTAGEPGWLRALRLRSEALNRRYGLGNPTRAVTAGEPGWLRALRLRSEALNRRYGMDGGTGKALAAPRHTDVGPPGPWKDESR